VGIAWAIFWSAACSGKPPLRLLEKSTGVTVDVQTLGEYQTTIHRIRLTDRSEQRVVWEIAARSGTPQIHSLTFVAGANPATIRDVQAGEYTVLIPEAGASFVLELGRQYTIEVWGSNSDATRASATFQLGGAKDRR